MGRARHREPPLGKRCFDLVDEMVAWSPLIEVVIPGYGKAHTT